MYIQFAFRWMNCLLMRELPQRAVVRAWDTYLSEENGFESFHVYVSAALLCHFSGTLREMDFQTMVRREGSRQTDRQTVILADTEPKKCRWGRGGGVVAVCATAVVFVPRKARACNVAECRRQASCVDRKSQRFLCSWCSMSPVPVVLQATASGKAFHAERA